MTDDELWMVTDIHVENGKGIAINELRQYLHEFELLTSCTYSFFGKMWSELPVEFKREEERLFAAGATNGWHTAGVWQKRH
jgi:hypothetical protein